MHFTQLYPVYLLVLSGALYAGCITDPVQATGYKTGYKGLFDLQTVCTTKHSKGDGKVMDNHICYKLQVVIMYSLQIYMRK